MGGDDEKRKRIIIISISTLFLVGMVAAVTLGVTFSKDGSGNGDEGNEQTKPQVNPSVKAVKTLCQPTDYKKECEESLSKEAGNTTDPRQLIMLAFNVTIKHIGDGLKETHLLHDVEKDHRAKLALDTCKQLMNLSIEEFKRSVDRMSSFELNNLNNILTSLKVWLSGAITYQETCIDAFENTTSDAGKKMKDILQTAMHMSSNGLAIITELDKTLTDMHITGTKSTGRRLFQLDDDDDDDDDAAAAATAGFPEWVDPAHLRRVLSKANSGSSGKKIKANVIVAKDGSGDCKTITEALKKVPSKNTKPFVIYIKHGVYQEYVEVTRQMTHVVFIGDGGNKTRITGNKNFIDGVNTYKTASVAIQGDYFVAIDMGFENSAGPEKHQAVAIRVQADKSIFYRCVMDGYQDTVYAHALRQFYRDCHISGTIDFVFGDAVAVFQNCIFVVRKPLQNQQCIVTAQGRKERHQPSGIIIQGGAIVADPKFYPVRFENKAYLARPWKSFSRTVFMDTFIDDLIQPEGYMPWQTPQGLTGMDTCFYAEINNHGPGSDLSKRVKWRGVKKLTQEHANMYLPSAFFHGDDWIKITKIPYNPGHHVAASSNSKQKQ